MGSQKGSEGNAGKNHLARRGGWLAKTLVFAVMGVGCDGVGGPAETDTEAVTSALSGHNLSGHNLSGHNLSGHNLSGHNLSGHNLSGHNLSGHNLSGHNLSGHNLSGHNLSGHNLSGHNLSGHNLSGHNLSGEDIGKSTDLATRTLGRPATGLLYSGEDLLPRASRCIAVGVGSTEFAEFLGKQTADSTLKVAIGKLPWGFADTNGALESSAWETVVEGDQSRCSYVLASPPETTWGEVAGFMKAIFRWHAPPTQTMEVSAIAASSQFDASIGTAVASHTGMMNAGGQWRAGRLSERSFVAGELAFVAATTNNRSVLVDFASWALDKAGAGLVLGNVESAKPPTYAESVYYAFENDDGTIGLGIGPASLDPVTVRYSDKLASSYQSLEVAYKLYQEGLFPRPIPTRCGGALFLSAQYGEPVAEGKCDSTVSWSAASASGFRTWQTEAGTTAPMNQYMLLPADRSTSLRRDGKVVLAETYVHMWETNYEYGIDSGARRERAGLLVDAAESPLPGSVQLAVTQSALGAR